MGFIPGYKHDVFISYAHIDNDPIIEGKHGWVTFFEEVLRKLVKGKLGEEINIFRDSQLHRYGEFSEQLIQSLSSSATFICVLSPRYVRSEWCLRELREFCRQGGAARIIKAVKYAVEEDEHPPEISGVLDTRFYRTDESTGKTHELHPEIKHHQSAYVEILESVAQTLADLLKRLRLSRAVAAPGIAASETATTDPARELQEALTVYLAQTTKDTEQERGRIRSELLQFNYRVLPDRPLPADSDEVFSLARHSLQQAKLSVHLVGEHYGIIPEGEDRSIPHIQYDLAADLSRENRLTQIVWAPPNLAPTEKKQQAFLDHVRNNSPGFLQVKIEDLKTEILKTLQSFSMDGQEESEEEEPINVCLYYDEPDIKYAGHLYTHLFVKETFKVRLPIKESRSLQDHKRLLQSSDAVILYYGNANQNWFANIWGLIQRYAAAKPVFVKAIYTSSPRTPEKDLLDPDDTDNPLIIKNYGDFTPGSLKPFIDRIRSVKGASP